MNCVRVCLIVVLAVCVMPCPAKAQYGSPVEYLDFLGNIESEMARDYLSYMSAMAHTNSARKLDKRRQEVLSTIKEGQKKVAALKAYKGDISLRDAYNKYFVILSAVMNEDYGKIVDMEEIAEQSYDKMEALFLAQDMAREKLKTASDSLRSSYQKFAANNAVKLIDSQSKVSKKLEQTSKVMAYYNAIYLIHFKVYKQEAYTIAALNSGDVNGIEQNRSTQLAYAEEGLEKLAGIKAFQVDYALVKSCRRVLEFQKNEAQRMLAGMTDYLIKKDEFDKFKKDYDSKPASQRSRGDVDDYNMFVAEMNKLGGAYNKTNDQLNAQRSVLLKDWNNSVDVFLDSHVPHD